MAARTMTKRGKAITDAVGSRIALGRGEVPGKLRAWDPHRRMH